MKVIVLILSLFVISFESSAQKKEKNNSRLEIDTLKRMTDTIFGNLRQYRNDTLVIEGNAFFIHVCEPRGKIFMRDSFCYTKVVRHGITTEYFPNGERKVTRISMGVIGETQYFNRFQQLIPYEKFISRSTMRDGTCPICPGFYFIEASKKVEKKKYSGSEKP
jgi:hypothetical protein